LVIKLVAVWHGTELISLLTSDHTHHQEHYAQLQNVTEEAVAEELPP